MAMPLKTQNAPRIWAVVIADAVILLGQLHSDSPFSLTTLGADFPRWVVALGGPVAVSALCSLLSPEMKASLVFWRIRDVLPGHRAFSVYAQSDSRIDTTLLEQAIGPFPELPKDQNTLWYRLYNQIKSDSRVSDPHRQFLLFRELAAVSAMLAVGAPVALAPMATTKSELWFAFMFFAVQYLVSMVASRHHGVRLVKNVLAIHASVRHETLSAPTN